jgi:hypothetical protein
MARQAGAGRDLLAMALVGYEAEKVRINAAIVEIQARLGTGAATPKRRAMSAAARKRMAAGQRKRWAAVKGQSKSAPAPKRRKLSAAGRRAIIEATRKRWAAYRKGAGKKKPITKAA